MKTEMTRTDSGPVRPMAPKAQRAMARARGEFQEKTGHLSEEALSARVDQVIAEVRQASPRTRLLLGVNFLPSTGTRSEVSLTPTS